MKNRLPFYYGWMIVAVVFVTMAIGVNARTAFSLLFPPIITEFGWDSSTKPAPASGTFVKWIGNSDTQQAQWIVRSYLLFAALGLGFLGDDEVRKAIAKLYEKHGYVADPHTAIGFLGIPEKRTGLSLFLATAHPSKFREVVQPIIKKDVPLPDALAETLARAKVVQRIRPELPELSKLL